MGNGYQATVAVVVGAAGTLGVVTTSTAAGTLGVSVTVPLISLEVQSREMWPAMPHL
jgi:hypothetical protein